MAKRIGYLLIAGLFAIGAIGWWQWYSAQSHAKQNFAVIDASATKEVQAHVSQALTSLLSFSYTDPQATEKAAAELLTGPASKEFDRLFADLLKNADGQELELSAIVRAAAVKELNDDEAKLLVFLDQRSQRAEDKESSISAAQLGISAQRVGPTWVINGIEVR